MLLATVMRLRYAYSCKEHRGKECTSQCFIIQLEYWKHFMARFDGVHALGYNFAEREPIWTKSGAFRVHCLGLALADFGRDPRSSESGRARRNFVFLSGMTHDFTDFPSARFHQI